MATCGYCNLSRGKRACPSLHSTICSRCCGQHRLKEIDCPVDCAWLGGLRVVRDPMRAGVPTHEAWSSALAKLFAYSKTAEVAPIAQQAIDRFFPDGRREVDDWETALLIAFMTYGHRDANGVRIIDRFIASRGRDLPADEVAALLAQQRAWAGLFEIVGVQAGAGLDLRDLVSGETIHVKEVSATAQAKRWDVVFAWVVELGDHLELTGAAAFVPRRHLNVVLHALKVELREARRARHGIPDQQLVGEIAWAPIRALRDAYDHVEMPQLRNMHGEELIFCKAHHRCRDVRKVRGRLSELAELEPTEEGFVWLDPQGHPSLGDGPLNLGTMRISRRDGRETLSADS